MFERDPVAKFDLRPLVEGRIVDQVGDGRHDARFVQDGRPYAADQSPGLGGLLRSIVIPVSNALAASFDSLAGRGAKIWNCMIAPANSWARPLWMS